MIPSTIKPEAITAIVDTREQDPLDLAPLRCVTATLGTGDYSVLGLEHVIAIERKSRDDLLSCVGRERERFEREIQRLLAYPVRAIVVESSWGELEIGQWRSKVTPSQATGSCLGWIAAGVPVVMAGNHQRAGQFIARLLFIAARRRWRENRAMLATLEAEAPAA